jgi:hypothetical protein
MSSILNNNFELSLKVFHPISHEMHVLEHYPVSDLTSLLEGLDSILLLTLSHRNVDELFVLESFSILLSDQFDFWSWINTREENEESWSLWVHFRVRLHNVKWCGFNIFGSHLNFDIVGKSIGKSIRSDSSEQKNSME